MEKAKIYPIVIEDYIPFCILVVATNKTQAKTFANDKYDWLKECEIVKYLPPINMNQGTVFAVDAEMNLTEDSDELFAWLCADSDGYFADGFRTKPDDLVEVEVEECGDNCGETSEETVEEENVESTESIDTKYIWL